MRIYGSFTQEEKVHTHQILHHTSNFFAMAPARFLSALLLLSSLSPVVEGGIFKKKHRRVKAGTKHADHDPIHIVVNKVG